MIAGGCVGAVDAGSPFDNVEVELQNAPLAEHEFGDGHEDELRALAEIGASRAEEEVFNELLGDGGSSAAARSFKVVFGGDLYFVPIEAVMLVEAGIFRGDDGVLKLRRNLIHRDETVALVIGRAMDDCLKAALHVDRSGGQVNPAKGDEGDGGEGPCESKSGGDADQDGAGADGLETNGPEF